MFKHDRAITHKFTVIHNQILNTDAWIEVQVVEGQRLLKHVPYRLLWVLQEQVAVQGQDGLGEPVAETDLELHVAVELGGLGVECRSTDKISVLVDAKGRPAVKVIDNAVHIDFILHALSWRNNLAHQRQANQCHQRQIYCSRVVHIF